MMLPVNKLLHSKRIVFILITIVLAIVGIVGGVYLVKQRQEIRKKAAPATTIYFQPSTKGALVGETVGLDIFVETGTNTLYSLSLEINYDNTTLEAKSLTFTSFLPDQLRPVNLSLGKITSSAGTGKTGGVANPPVSGEQKIASISFKILGASSGTTISFGPETTAYTGIGEDIGANLINRTIPATIIAQAQESTLTPTPTLAASTPTPTTGGIGGSSLPTSTPTSTPTPTSIPNSPTPIPTPTSGGTGGGLLPTSTPTSTPTISADSIGTGGIAETTAISTPTPTPQEPPVAGNLLPTLSLLALGNLFVFAFFLFIFR